jgi:hypothetical protein
LAFSVFVHHFSLFFVDIPSTFLFSIIFFPSGLLFFWLNHYSQSSFFSQSSFPHLSHFFGILSHLNLLLISDFLVSTYINFLNFSFFSSLGFIFYFLHYIFSVIIFSFSCFFFILNFSLSKYFLLSVVHFIYSSFILIFLVFIFLIILVFTFLFLVILFYHSLFSICYYYFFSLAIFHLISLQCSVIIPRCFSHFFTFFLHFTTNYIIFLNGEEVLPLRNVCNSFIYFNIVLYNTLILLCVCTYSVLLFIYSLITCTYFSYSRSEQM